MEDPAKPAFLVARRWSGYNAALTLGRAVEPLINADGQGLATETAFIVRVNMVLRSNMLIAMRLSALVCVHLRFQG